jgi:WhiB family transcriptional regulator, redox-sensing transcriptional regulator
VTRSAEAPGWQARPCLGTPLELWYGPDSDTARESPIERGWRDREALRLCAGCPVQDACLAEELGWGIANQWGVRGGLTAEQRKALIRRGADEPRRSA